MHFLPMVRSFTLVGALTLTVAGTVPAALAQGSSEPNVTTASYGDWVLRCQRVEKNGTSNRSCEVAQMIQIAGQPKPIAQIAIGRSVKSEPLRMAAAVPVMISLPSPVIVSGEKDAKIINLDWRRCVPDACLADVALRDDNVKRIRGLSSAGSIAFKDAAGRDVQLPISFKGLSQALDALTKEGF